MPNQYTPFIMKSVEIICTNCGADTLLHREAVYDGFTKTGDQLSCATCGHVFNTEENVPYKNKKDAPKIFTDADRTEAIELFEEGENRRLCRYCSHYIVNPFTQYCSVHKKEVQATDSCNRFEDANEKDAPKTPLL